MFRFRRFVFPPIVPNSSICTVFDGGHRNTAIAAKMQVPIARRER
jgi:hypothetical protein